MLSGIRDKELNKAKKKKSSSFMVIMGTENKLTALINKIIILYNKCHKYKNQADDMR